MMRKVMTVWGITLILLLGVSAGARSASAEAGEPAGKAAVKTQSLQVYSDTSSARTVVKTLEKGDQVVIDFEVVTGEGNWCGIREGGGADTIGFVACKDLETAEAQGRRWEQIEEPPPVPENTKKQEPSVQATNAENLIQAVISGRTEMVKELLKRGADVNAKDKAGSMTPLIWAADLARADIVRILLKAGADVRLKDKTGRTALKAARSNLAEMGKNLQQLNRPGSNKYFRPRMGRYSEVIRLLMEAGAKE